MGCGLTLPTAAGGRSDGRSHSGSRVVVHAYPESTKGMRNWSGNRTLARDPTCVSTAARFGSSGRFRAGQASGSGEDGSPEEYVRRIWTRVSAVSSSPGALT
jgi:hypothetical protein